MNDKARREKRKVAELEGAWHWQLVRELLGLQLKE